MKYLRCIFIGLPLWFIIGILVAFSPEIRQALKIQGEVKVAQAIAFCLSRHHVRRIRQRLFQPVIALPPKSLFAFLLFTLAAMAAYFLCAG